MRYIYRDSNGEDDMEIEVSDERVVSLKILGEPGGVPSTYTAEDLQNDLSLYLDRTGVTIEDALAAYAGGYGSFRKVGE
jgi:hypothetical protein